MISKGYILLDLETLPVFISKNAIFIEKVFPFPLFILLPLLILFLPRLHLLLPFTTHFLFFIQTQFLFLHHILLPSPLSPNSSSIVPFSSPAISSPPVLPSPYVSSPPVSSSIPLRRSTWVTSKTSYLPNYDCTVHNSFSIHNLNSCDLFHSDFKTLALSLMSQEEPFTYAETVKSVVWRQAMATELATLEANKTWCYCITNWETTNRL